MATTAAGTIIPRPTQSIILSIMPINHCLPLFVLSIVVDALDEIATNNSFMLQVIIC
jgi:hypothetical protein